MTEDSEVDFSARKSEAEWQEALDSFWLAATPHWFEWLGWLLIMAALTYVVRISGSAVPTVVLGLSYAALFMYLQSFLFRFRFVGLPRISNPRVARGISLAISGGLATGTYLLLREALQVVVATGGL